MDIRIPTRFGPGKSKSPSTERFLGDLSLTTPQNLSPSSTSTADELSEDDIFSTADFSLSDLNHRHSTVPSSSPAPFRPDNSRLNRLSSSLASSPSSSAIMESFGILAALPEHTARSVFNHKASQSLSTATSSSSRMIPGIPKPPQERFPGSSSSLFSSAKYHQSAPVNVPVMPRRQREFDDEEEEDEDEDGDGGEMLPPHEIVARSLARSQRAACSVLEGAGRTLKGRDLRQVRNAVWQQTGFLD